MKQNQWSYSTLSLILLIASLIAINVVGNFIPLRLDITSDQLYTVSEGTEEILDKLDDPVTIKLYVNKDNTLIPPNIKNYIRRVEDLLGEYAQKAKGKIRLEIFDPKPDSEEEESARQYNISAISLPTGESFYFGMVALLLDQEVTIPFFDSRREKFLEYDISQALVSVNTDQSKKIGIISSLNMAGGFAQAPGQRPPTAWVFYSELKKIYEVQTLSNVSEIPDDITVLLVIHPKNMSESEQYAVDQFVVRGGRLIVLVDPNSYYELQNTPRRQFQVPNVSSNLPVLLKAWGVEFQANQVVGDFKYATPVNSQKGPIRFPFWMSFTQEAMLADHPLTNQLESLLMTFAGELKKMEDSTATFEPILQTSPESGLIESFMTQNAQPELLIRELKTDQKSKVIAALISDSFKSAFPDGPPQQEAEETEPMKHEHLKEAKNPGNILIVADVDFLSDQFSVQKLSFLGQNIIQPLNDNLNFMLNAIDFLSGDTALMSIRARGRFSRPFTRVLELESQAQQRFQQEEIALQNALKEVQERLSALQQQKDDKQKTILSVAQQAEVKRFRQEELRTRKRLREVRKILRQDIENLGNWLLAINMLLIPTIIALIGIVSYTRRNRSQREKP